MEKFDPGDLLALRKLTRAIATLYLLQMLQMISLRVIDMNLAVEQTRHQPTAIMIELKRSDEMIRFWITGHSSGVDSPQTDDFIGAPTRNAVVLWDVEDGASDDVLVS